MNVMMMGMMTAVMAISRAGASTIQSITDQNYETTAAQGDWYLKFYSPYCGACNKMKPTYIEATEAIGPSMNFGEINCIEETELSKIFNIKVYPTLIRVSGDKGYKFEGDVFSAQQLQMFAETGWVNDAKAFTRPRIGDVPSVHSDAPSVMFVVVFGMTLSLIAYITVKKLRTPSFRVNKGQLLD
uniref:Thioredoxin domain-containing protein n=1 Tax=Spongospora subterranea TaxID=70186 RepID=A0A0H5RBY3_9EUKA|eukprot:CRZ11112.1 hypothetical protein [Spongospora subterranea]